MADAPKVQKGEGLGELPEGAAKKLNDEAQAVASDPTAPGAEMAGNEGPQIEDPQMDPAMPEDISPKFTPGHPAEEFLTQEPEEIADPGMGGTSPGAHVTPPHRMPVPDSVRDGYPMLKRAAQAPDAPPQLQTLVRLLEFHMNR